MINNHRKVILDKFYNFVDQNINNLPPEITDLTAEIFNMEEELIFWKNQYKTILSRELSAKTMIQQEESLSRA